jgi:hypothetical protein
VLVCLQVKPICGQFRARSSIPRLYYKISPGIDSNYGHRCAPSRRRIAYTETVVKGEVTLYRARFAGFSGKDEARAACAHLTKKEFACLALRN